MPAPTTGDRLPIANPQAKPNGMSGPPPNGGYHQPPPYSNQPHFQQPYGGPPPSGGPQQFPNGYNMWHNGQQQQQQPPPYGGPQPGWAGGQGPPHNMGMYRQGGPPPNSMGGPDRGNWNGYRGPPNQPGRRGPPQPENSPPRQSAKGGKAGGDGPPQQYWGHQQQQWPQHSQWGGGPHPSHGWQGGPPPIQQPGPSPPPNMPQHMQGPPKMWGGRNGMTSPTRPTHHNGPRRSPETMPNGMMGNGYRMSGMDASMCKPLDGEEMGMYMSRGDDGKSKNMSDKDKGRGSYRCGRCGAPKKGHVCPYQPKLKRRPDEPPPEMRNAAVQVEMDEFMTLRRLNIEIQGFPESYATAPLLADNMVVGEPHPLALGSAGVVTTISDKDSPDLMRSSPTSTAPSPVVETGA